MTKKDCLAVMAYLATAVNKAPLSDQAGDVYYDLLGDLKLDIVKAAAKKVALSHVWATFPSVAELRQAAIEIMQGERAEINAAKAWEFAWKATREIDLEVTGPFKVRIDGEWQTFPSQAAYVLSKYPSVVVEAMNAFGLAALLYGKEPVTIVRSQFMVMYGQAQERRDSIALLPPKLKAEIESLPASVAQAIGQIGLMEGGK